MYQKSSRSPLQARTRTYRGKLLTEQQKEMNKIKSSVRFRYRKNKHKEWNWCVPHAITFARVLQKLSLQDLQNAFAEFLNALIQETTLVGAVDGKVAKQMKDEQGDLLLMLNVFAQELKLHLASWSVDGDKTNEPGCLKKHLEELFTMYPSLKLLMSCRQRSFRAIP